MDEPASIQRSLLAGIVDEFLAEQRAGRSPSIEEYAARVPGREAELRELLELVTAFQPSALAEEAPGHGDARPESPAELEPGASLGVPTQASDTAALLGRLADRQRAEWRYQEQGEVARGGMGAILKVWDEDLRRHLAMKVIGSASPVREDGEAVDPRLLARFLEEAQITGQLDHPGVVPVHELGLDSKGRVYFTMRLVKGRDLKAIIEEVHAGSGGWTQTKALSVIIKVCEAVAYAHSKGVIHRDLKPANVMVGRFGETYVMDWGLAKVVGREDHRDLRPKADRGSTLSSIRTTRREEAGQSPESPLLTMDGSVIGTPAYMSPEQARGEVEKVDARSDVYAVGAMLYHLLTGEMPYVPRDVKVGGHAVWRFVLEGPPRPVHALAPKVPAELEAICEKAMSRESGARYGGLLEMAEDLQAYIDDRVVRAYETGAWAELKKWTARNKLAALATAGEALALIAGITVSTTLYLRSEENARLAGEERARADAKTVEAERNADESRRNATVAEQNAKVAKQNEAHAIEQERIAAQRANDVLSLSTIQELNELVVRADGLWPALPDKLAEYERWLADAKVLIEGRAVDPSRGIAVHPGLKDHEAKLAEIRRRAKALTSEQVEADRRASPSFAEWDRSRTKLTWLRCMLGEEPWATETDVEAQLSEKNLPTDAEGLNGVAWALVDPDPLKVVYGNEIEALILARRALAAAQEGARFGFFRDTLARALYRCGRLDEALSEQQRAVAQGSGNQRARLSASQQHLELSVASWRDPVLRAEHFDEAKRLTVHVAELELDMNTRRTWEFDDSRDRWWHAQLSALVADLEGLQDNETGLCSEGVSEPHGWGVAKRAVFARTIEDRSIGGTQATRLWKEALESISNSAMYHGIVSRPQLGLLPIGIDSDSRLWEFAHLASGEPAERGSNGKLIFSEGTGLVFVLIPASRFWMGAQREDPNSRNYCPDASINESPVHEVELSAYYLSKYEMTQGQWQRLVGHNPSQYSPNAKITYPRDLRHPVESVAWTDCVRLMARMGLSLPSEAQWENGCRGGADTPWWTGAERESLRGRVNLADQTAKAGGVDWPSIKDWPDLEDGWVVHAPVGSFAPNPYGLHEVHGNVSEWCQDGYVQGFYGRAWAKDPLAPWDAASFRINRGGSYALHALVARAACRQRASHENRDPTVGLRPAMGIK